MCLARMTCCHWVPIVQVYGSIELNKVAVNATNIAANNYNSQNAPINIVSIMTNILHLITAHVHCVGLNMI